MTDHKRDYTNEATVIRPEGKDGYPDDAVAWTRGPGGKDYQVPYSFLKGLKMKFAGMEWVMYVGRDVAARRDWETRWGLWFPGDAKGGSASCHALIYELTPVPGLQRLGMHNMVQNGCMCGNRCLRGIPFWIGQDVSNEEMVQRMAESDHALGKGVCAK